MSDKSGEKASKTVRISLEVDRAFEKVREHERETFDDLARRVLQKAKVKV